MPANLPSTENPLGRPPANPYGRGMEIVPWDEVLRMSGKNIGPSALKYLQNVVYPFAHPIEFSRLMGNLALGGVQKLIPGEQSKEPYADLFWDTLSSQYGSEGGLKKHVAVDPVGAFADATAVSGLGSWLLPVAGAGRLGKFSQTAKKGLGRVGNLDPAMLPFMAAQRLLNKSFDPNVAALMARGIDPTIGQILGGIPHRIEQKIESIPGLGEIVTSAKGRSAKQMNRAAMNEVLAPIGGDASDLPTGHEGIAALKDRISDEYDKILPSLHLEPDEFLTDKIRNIIEEMKGILSDDKGRAFERLVNLKVLSRLTRHPEMDGQQVKNVMAELGKVTRDFKGHSGDDNLIANAFGEVKEVLDSELRFQNPEAAQRLKAADNAWARYKIVESAGAAAGATKESGFSAYQLAAAARKHDRSINKSNVATGRGLMADFINPAVQVLGNTVPDSGTAGRAALTSALLGGGLATISPTAFLTSAAGAIPYTSVGQAAISKGLVSGQPWANFLGKTIEEFPRFGSSVQQSGKVAGLWLNPEEHERVLATPTRNMEQDLTHYLMTKGIPEGNFKPKMTPETKEEMRRWWLQNYPEEIRAWQNESEENYRRFKEKYPDLARKWKEEDLKKNAAQH